MTPAEITLLVATLGPVALRLLKLADSKLGKVILAVLPDLIGAVLEAFKKKTPEIKE